MLDLNENEGPKIDELLLEAEEYIAERSGAITAKAPLIAAPRPALRHDTVAILDFGSQYSQLIARRVRELGVYCELLPFDAPAAEIERVRPQAYILSGGPSSVYDEGAPGLPQCVCCVELEPSPGLVRSCHHRRSLDIGTWLPLGHDVSPVRVA